VRSLLLALLYSVGAHGIMTLNDFKSIEGDKQMGIGSLPVQLGVRWRGACGLLPDGRCRRRWWWCCCWTWGARHALGVLALLAVQLGLMMAAFCATPRAGAGTAASGAAVRAGMMVSAFALRAGTGQAG
jgi:chlorophyll synthase